MSESDSDRGRSNLKKSFSRKKGRKEKGGRSREFKQRNQGMIVSVKVTVRKRISPPGLV